MDRITDVDSALSRSRCSTDWCGGRGALLRVRTNPRNFHEERAQLCGPCAKKGGWADAFDYVRPAVMPL